MKIFNKVPEEIRSFQLEDQEWSLRLLCKEHFLRERPNYSLREYLDQIMTLMLYLHFQWDYIKS